MVVPAVRYRDTTNTTANPGYLLLINTITCLYVIFNAILNGDMSTCHVYQYKV